MIFSLGHPLRIARAGFVLSRAGLFRDVDITALPPVARLPFALAKSLGRGETKGPDLLPAAISRLGPSYVKLGQFLATRPDVVGPDVARRLEALQDHMPPFPQAEAVSMVETAFGRKIEEVFVAFGPPVAAASIAQVIAPVCAMPRASAMLR